jgi:hypothetical protein
MYSKVLWSYLEKELIVSPTRKGVRLEELLLEEDKKKNLPTYFSLLLLDI